MQLKTIQLNNFAHFSRTWFAYGILAAAIAYPCTSLALDEEASVFQDRQEMLVPVVSADRGRQLFVTKGCVMCHSINDTGGKGAAALDADTDDDRQALDLMGFVARMWRGAPAMIDLQATELGYVIDLEGHDIADIAAFTSSPIAQAGFSIEDVPEPMRDLLLDKPYWEEDDWPETLNHGVTER